jgi:DNA processing protein
MTDLMQENTYQSPQKPWYQWLLYLYQIRGCGPVRQRRLVEKYAERSEGKVSCVANSALREAIEGLHEPGRRKAAWETAEREWEYCMSKGIGIRCLWDSNYPRLLRECPDAPLLLFYKGCADLNSSPVISIVGTRKMTYYGRRFCAELMDYLLPYRPIIVSGMARGVDMEAQLRALNAGLVSVAVLAHGLKHTYPPSHKGFRRQLEEEGGVLTEFLSGEPPLKMQFVRRNRIIAGLSEATIVVESDIKGGSLITAGLALDYDREVLAVPGRIGDRFSSGTNRLIAAQGAQPICSASEIPELLGWPKRYPVHSSHRPEGRKGPTGIPAGEDSLADRLFRTLLEMGPSTVDELTAHLGASLSELSVLLLELELARRLNRDATGRYELVGDT